MDSLVFNKWSSAVEITDPSLKNYINLGAKLVYLTQGRTRKKGYGKAKVHIVERLINTLMRNGTGGKVGGKLIRGRHGAGGKTKMYNEVKNAFTLIEQKEKKNPVEVLIRALENSAPREETTRVKYGGVVTPIAVDVSPQRRVDFALRNIGRAVVIRSFDTPKSAVDALADELILASKNDPASHAISRKNETERMASSSR